MNIKLLAALVAAALALAVHLVLTAAAGFEVATALVLVVLIVRSWRRPWVPVPRAVRL